MHDIEDRSQSPTLDQQSRLWDATDQLLRHKLPYLQPSLPDREARSTAEFIANPFADGDNVRQRYAVKAASKAPEKKPIRFNGYVKFDWNANISDSDAIIVAAQQPRLRKVSTATRQESVLRQLQAKNGIVPVVSYLPPNYGQVCELNQTDHNFLRFCECSDSKQSTASNMQAVKLTITDTQAFCKGRTVLPDTNSWLVDITPTISNPCVKRALLALAAGYVLDYKPDKQLVSRANWHYKRAVELFGKELNDKRNQEVGKDDAILAALWLLYANDVGTSSSA